MYWNTTPVSSIYLESLLNKNGVTLQEIMDAEEVLQECKYQNKRLIDYLVRTDVLEKLISLTTEEPSGNEDDTVKYKYSNIACELLTSEVPQLIESLAMNEALLRKLYSFLDGDAPLNPLLASFFSKTLSVLITRNSEQNWYSYQFTCLKVLEFLKLKEDSISLLLKHLGTSAIMDLIFKLITKVEGSDMNENLLNWMDEKKLTESVVALLDPSNESDIHYNAAQLLCDVIRTSRMNKINASQPNKILDKIESPEVVNLLLDHILKEPKCETSIVGGISVLLTLLENICDDVDLHLYEEASQYNTDHMKVVSSTTKAILPRLKDFHDILINPPVKPAVKTTITVLEPPLGNTRIEVAKLLSVLVSSSKEEINKELVRLNTVNVLLDLFFKYTWNNFLHTQVQKFLGFALSGFSASEGGDEEKNCLIAHILSDCHLIQRILDAWQDNETQQTEHKRPRRGYMGHLIEIATNIVVRAETHSFSALMKETVDSETLAKWENFVNTKLSKIHETHTVFVDGGHSSFNDKGDGEGKDGSFGDYAQELYTHYYQLQALAPAFTGEFGSFQEDQFNDDEDILNTPASPNFQKVNFTVNEENADEQAEFFEKVCAQKFQTLDDYNGDVWNENGPSTKTKRNAEKDWEVLENSSSEEDEEDENHHPKGDSHLDFNMLSSWPGETDIAVPPAESLNPWESTGNVVTSPDLGWANFESASFVANFGLNLNPDINTTIATSTSCEGDTTITLDLTPSENNVKVEEMFSTKSEEEDEDMERPEVVENNPKSIEYTDLEIITKAADKCSLNSDSQSSPSGEGGSDEATATATTTTKEEDEDKAKTKSELESAERKEKMTEELGETKMEVEEKEKEKVEREEKEPKGSESEKNQVNCLDKPEIVENVNSLVKANEEETGVDGNSRFHSSQGLTTNSEKEFNSGDSYQLLKGNVQAVPNEPTQTSNKEIGSNSPEDKSANGPI